MTLYTSILEHRHYVPVANTFKLAPSELQTFWRRNRTLLAPLSNIPTLPLLTQRTLPLPLSSPVFERPPNAKSDVADSPTPASETQFVSAPTTVAEPYIAASPQSSTTTMEYFHTI